MLRGSCLDVLGLRIFGSPLHPRQPKRYHPMAFGRTRGTCLKNVWNDAEQVCSLPCVYFSVLNGIGHLVDLLTSCLSSVSEGWSTQFSSFRG